MFLAEGLPAGAAGRSYSKAGQEAHVTGPPLWYRRARRVGALRRGERGPGVAARQRRIRGLWASPARARRRELPSKVVRQRTGHLVAARRPDLRRRGSAPLAPDAGELQCVDAGQELAAADASEALRDDMDGRAERPEGPRELSREGRRR